MYILFVCLNKYWLYKIFTGAMKALNKPKKEDKIEKPSDEEGTELIDKNSKGEWVAIYCSQLTLESFILIIFILQVIHKQLTFIISHLTFPGIILAEVALQSIFSELRRCLSGEKVRCRES